MDRREFMRQLERLLADIPKSDRQDAIDYYNSYFDEAGVENEEDVIQELGNPGKVAGIIKADLSQNSYTTSGPEYTEHGYQDAGTTVNKQMPSRRESGYREPKAKSKFPVALIIIILVFTIPIWGGLAAGLLGVLVGIAGVLVGIIVGSCFGGVGLVIGGIATMVVSVVSIVSHPGTALAGIGIALLMIAVGLLLFLFFLWFTFKICPMAFRSIVDLCQRLLNRGESQREHNFSESDRYTEQNEKTEQNEETVTHTEEKDTDNYSDKEGES